jgi:hypothetical protein
VNITPTDQLQPAENIPLEVEEPIPHYNENNDIEDGTDSSAGGMFSSDESSSGLEDLLDGLELEEGHHHNMHHPHRRHAAAVVADAPVAVAQPLANGEGFFPPNIYL